MGKKVNTKVVGSHLFTTNRHMVNMNVKNRTFITDICDFRICDVKKMEWNQQRFSFGRKTILIMATLYIDIYVCIYVCMNVCIF